MDAPNGRNPDPSDRIDAEARDPVVCSRCGNPVSEPEDVISVGGEPPLRVQVNPHGHTFEVLTMGRARGLVRVGSPQTEHSWFAGYAWTIVCCDDCSSHIGWQFDALAGALPARFFGFVRSRIAGV